MTTTNHPIPTPPPSEPAPSLRPVEGLQALCDAATPLADYPGYAVDRSGTVWSIASNWRGYGSRPITQVPTHDGYRKVRFTMPDGSRTNRSVHRLVAETFLGPRPGAQVCHINGDPADNRLENLRWGTALDNARDRDRHGTTARGERNGYASLTDEAVVEIRKLLAEGVPQRAIARRLGTSQKTVWSINRGVAWPHVA